MVGHLGASGERSGDSSGVSAVPGAHTPTGVCETQDRPVLALHFGVIPGRQHARDEGFDFTVVRDWALEYEAENIEKP